MENLPWFVPTLFCATVLLGVWLFSKATHYSKIFMAFIFAVIIIQSLLGFSGFYNNLETMTNRFPLLVLPTLIPLFSLFFIKKGKEFIENLDIKWVTIYNIIRVFVEICLFYLFVYKTIPQAMTFEGRNFDIFSGITAPIVLYFGFINKKLSNTVLIAWNIICILLLLSVVSSAVLSLPARYQNFGFETPNIAIGYFPFLLLPSILVPLALFANATSIYKIIKNKLDK